MLSLWEVSPEHKPLSTIHGLRGIRPSWPADVREATVATRRVPQCTRLMIANGVQQHEVRALLALRGQRPSYPPLSAEGYRRIRSCMYGQGRSFVRTRVCFSPLQSGIISAVARVCAHLKAPKPRRVSSGPAFCSSEPQYRARSIRPRGACGPAGSPVVPSCSGRACRP